MPDVVWANLTVCAAASGIRWIGWVVRGMFGAIRERSEHYVRVRRPGQSQVLHIPVGPSHTTPGGAGPAAAPAT